MTLYKDSDFKHEISFPVYVDRKQTLYVKASVTGAAAGESSH